MPDGGQTRHENELLGEMQALRELNREQHSVQTDTPRFAKLVQLIEEKSRAIFAIGHEKLDDPEEPDTGGA